MKYFIYIIVTFIFIPFFIATFFIHDTQPNEESIILESNRQIRVKREEKNVIETINLEDYIVGVIAGEMPIHFEMEALKAQAVAARSYALKRMEYNSDKNHDIVDTVLNQVYLDDEHLKKSWENSYEENMLKVRTAVLSTKGEYIEYNGKIADALYFSTSNGFTENSEEIFGFEVPYLRSVESIWDAEVSPVFNETKKYNIKDFYEKLELKYKENITINIIKKSSTGRILNLKINNIEMTGSKLASKLKLRSNDFEINQNEKEIIIKTKGFGHGVGMSQYGAQGMAKQGYKYDEILKHYYKETKISKI